MSVSILQRLFAFFDNIWSFILTLVRSLLALFSFRRRTSSDPFTLPSVARTPRDTLARTHARLRPILLTPRSITAARRAQSTRSHSATSTLFPGYEERVSASASEPNSAPPPSGPQRTSPKLHPDNRDAELGLPTPTALDAPEGPPSTSATSSSSRECTPDMSLPTTHTASLSVVPLTPPDRCYLDQMPSATDCPYAEPWRTTGPIDRTSKSPLPGSPLKVSINTADQGPVPGMVQHVRIGSLPGPPGRWRPPVQVWTSTPCKTGAVSHCLPDPPVGSFDQDQDQNEHAASTTGRDPLVDISNALISRSRNSIHPYDDAPDLSIASSSVESPFADDVSTRATRPLSLRHFSHSRPQSHSQSQRQYHSQSQNQNLHLRRNQNQNRPLVYPRFHPPDAYAHVYPRWRHHPARLPGRPDRNSTSGVYGATWHARSRSHGDILGGPKTTHDAWYDAGAYLHSPAAALSPPRADPKPIPNPNSASSTASSEDSMPLGRLRERLVRRSIAAGVVLPLVDDTRKTTHLTAVGMSPHTWRMSEGCLLALSGSTPTRIGVPLAVGARTRKGFDGEGYPKDWLEALSLRFPTEQQQQQRDLGVDVVVSAPDP